MLVGIVMEIDHPGQRTGSSVPCSGSVAEPEKFSIVPAVYLNDAAGVRIVGTGAPFPVTVSVAGSLVIDPSAFETTTRNWLPLSLAATFDSV